ncbi:hypothetical protein SteCoe_10068 [Stentor coeruleus]|uniref:Uncharacterized protein n=1 Tax=Stentor coeruleus TaxID=5963 RepID=A0A1R2CGC8_9CILI|nr:hypothetical protein SteCoe_10068 [Stentor coeruleus]
MMKKQRKVKQIKDKEAQTVDEPDDWSRTPSSSLRNNNAQEDFAFDFEGFTSAGAPQGGISRKLPNTDRNESNFVEEFKNNAGQNHKQVLDENRMDIDS